MRGRSLLAAALLLAIGCRPAERLGGRGPAGRRSGGTGGPQAPPEVPPGVRLVSFDAERGRAAAGGLLEPAWSVQLTAEARDAGGRPAKGVPVSFHIGRRTGRGVVLGAALSGESVLTDERGRACILLVSSDRAERCRVYAACGAVTLGAEVAFTRGRPPEFTVALADRSPPAPLPWPEAEIEERVERLLAAIGRGGEAAAAARREVATMGRGAIGPLLRIIYDENRPAGQRQGAAKALAIVKDEMVLKELLAGLESRRAAVRSGAESGLFERGAARSGEGVRRVAMLGAPLGRASALRVLAAWGRRQDVALLASRAGADPHPLARATAAWKLKAFAERPEARAALRGALADKSPFVRYTAAKACALAGAAVAGADSPDLGPALRDPDPRVRAAAARAVRSPGGAEALLALLADGDPRVRRAAAGSLGGPLFGGPGVRARLRQLACDRDAHVAELAFRALVAKGGVAEAEHMLTALRGSDAALAGRALGSLERAYKVEFGRPRFRALPAEGLVRQWSEWVGACRRLAPAERFQRAAVLRNSHLRGEALLEQFRVGKKTGGGPGAGMLRRAEAMAAGSDPRVRAPAAAVLWLLGRERGREVLMEGLTSRDWPARYAAARAARCIRKPKVLAALVELLDDRSSAIRAAAHRSLVELAGRDLGFDPEAADAERLRARARWKKWAESASMAPGEESERAHP